MTANQPLWAKGIGTDDAILQFTAGQDQVLDLHLAPWDVLGSMAHATMLANCGLIPKDEAGALLRELHRLHGLASQGQLLIDDGVEDIHTQVELLLTRTLGDAGKRLHTARSRNDQVLLDIKLYLRHQIQQVAGLVQRLFAGLMAAADQYKDYGLPGYTHYQPAMPSSYGLWYSAYAESLLDDLAMLHAAWLVANRNPLGSAAGYGSTFPIDRELTTALLGFEAMNYSSVYAQMTRGKAERVMLEAVAGLASTMGRFAADVVLYACPEFGFLKLDDAFTTGSSIMPQKKNPDVFELLRAKSNLLRAAPMNLHLLTASLPSGYHRDMQLTKEILFPTLDELTRCLNIWLHALPAIHPTPGLLDGNRYETLYAVEAANLLVSQGVPFRDAYKQVAVSLADGTYARPQQLAYTHQGSTGNLCLPQLQRDFDQRLAMFPFAQVQAALAGLLASGAC